MSLKESIIEYTRKVSLKIGEANEVLLVSTFISCILYLWPSIKQLIEKTPGYSDAGAFLGIGILFPMAYPLLAAFSTFVKICESNEWRARNMFCDFGLYALVLNISIGLFSVSRIFAFLSCSKGFHSLITFLNFSKENPSPITSFAVVYSISLLMGRAITWQRIVRDESLFWHIIIFISAVIITFICVAENVFKGKEPNTIPLVIVVYIAALLALSSICYKDRYSNVVGNVRSVIVFLSIIIVVLNPEKLFFSRETSIGIGVGNKFIQ